MPTLKILNETEKAKTERENRDTIGREKAK